MIQGEASPIANGAKYEHYTSRLRVNSYWANEPNRDAVRGNLRQLFPHPSGEQLKIGRRCFYGYLEIAWRIFERIEAEEAHKAQEKWDEPEFESPRGSAFF